MPEIVELPELIMLCLTLTPEEDKEAIFADVITVTAEPSSLVTKHLGVLGNTPDVKFKVQSPVPL